MVAVSVGDDLVHEHDAGRRGCEKTCANFGRFIEVTVFDCMVLVV
jgi:hypothetical protein